MPRRSYCTGEHTWVSTPRRGPASWKCTACPAQLPCPGVCAHLDCEDVRGTPPNCPGCSKPAEWGKSIIVSRGERGFRFHEECLDKATFVDDDEGEEEDDVPEQAA